MNEFRPDHLIWLQTAFLGDVVLTTAALSVAAKHFPDCKQTVITTRAGAEILAGFPGLECLVFEKKGLGFHSFYKIKQALKKSCGKHPVILQVHRSFRSSFLAKYLGFPCITYTESNFSFLASQRILRIPVLHEAFRIGLLLEPLGVLRSKILNAQPYLEPLTLEAQTPWQAQLKNWSGPFLALAPGSVWGTKRWPVAYFKDLALKLKQLRPDLGLILLGSPTEKILTDEIEQHLHLSAGVFNLAGKTSLTDLRRILPAIKLLIANDSSPIHFASALQTPTLALFGATTPALGFGPLAKLSHTLGIDALSCRPCSEHGPKVCPLTHFKCMKELSVLSVFETARSFAPFHENNL